MIAPFDTLWHSELRITYSFDMITLVFLICKHARNKNSLMIFQPTRPFLLHENEQGVKPCLVKSVEGDDPMLVKRLKKLPKN